MVIVLCWHMWWPQSFNKCGDYISLTRTVTT